MHHMWMVRSNLDTKFKHRSFLMGSNKNLFTESLEHWKTWRHGMPGMAFGTKKHILYEQTHTIKLTNFYKYAKKR